MPFLHDECVPREPSRSCWGHAARGRQSCLTLLEAEVPQVSLRVETLTRACPDGLSCCTVCLSAVWLGDGNCLAQQSRNFQLALVAAALLPCRDTDITPQSTGCIPGLCRDQLALGNLAPRNRHLPSTSLRIWNQNCTYWGFF